MEAKSPEQKKTNSLMPDTNLPRIVVIGGGFGGIQIAKKLAHRDLQVVMVDKQNYHTFQPLLYQVATAGLEADAIASPLRTVFEGSKNFYFRLAEVEKIVWESNMLETNIGILKYDYLVIANGAKTNYFGNKQMESLVFPMKQLNQALELRSQILENMEKALLVTDRDEQQSLIDFVIVGGGPTGVELAGALGELKLHVLPNDHPELDFRQMDIHLIEGSPRLLNGMSENAGKYAVEYLKKFQVDVWLNTVVKEYDGRNVVLSNGKTLSSQTVIWAAGVTGNLIPGLPETAIVRGNRIKTDVFSKVEGIGNVFAIGDISYMETKSHPKGFAQVAPVAMQQGVLLAKNLKKHILEKKPMTPFSYKDQGSMATIGRNRAVVDFPFIKFQGFFAWFVWLFVHLLSIAGFRNRLAILLNWFWNYFTYDRATRLIVKPFKRIIGD